MKTGISAPPTGNDFAVAAGVARPADPLLSGAASVHHANPGPNCRPIEAGGWANGLRFAAGRGSIGRVGLEADAAMT